MKRYLRIGLSVVFVVAVSVLVFRSCVHKSPFEGVRRYTERAAPKKPAAKSPKSAAQSARPADVPKGPAKMAIVLDDWGNNYSRVSAALDIRRPLTLSVIPNLAQSRRVAEAAHANGLGVMLHMPMEPRGGHEPLEPHTIMTDSSGETIRAYLDEALLSVPYADGVNNHQGSAATSDARVMRVFLAHLKSKRLFFIDSAVISTTKGPAISRELGIPYSKRDVFIDNELNAAAIKKQLLYAAKMARLRGRVIVIGHDHKVTLETIKNTLPEIESQGVKLVLAKELIKT